MLNIKKTLTKILDALKYDYIIEQGTSGEWKYRKWNSGYMEATLKKANPTVGSATSISGIQRMPITIPTIPTFTEILDVSVSGHNSGAWVSGTIDSTGQPAVFLLKVSGASTGLSYMSMRLLGKWK